MKFQVLTTLLWISFVDINGYFLRFLSINRKLPYKQCSFNLPSISSPRYFFPKQNLFRGDGGSVGNGNGGNNNNGGIFAFNSEDDDPDDAQKSKEGILSYMKVLSDLYSEKLISNPYSTKMLSSAVVGAIGDLLSQYLGKTREIRYQLRRILVFMSVASLYVAPVIHVWFNFLNNIPIPSGVGSSVKALVMLGIDQTIGAFFINIGFFMAFELAQRLIPPYFDQELSYFDQTIDSLKKNLWRTLVASWYCWPFINFAIFRFVPLHFRVLASNSAAVFWNVFLSMVANS